MAGAFDVNTADVNKGQQFPAPITKVEFRENGGDASQWNDYGDINGCTLDIVAKFATVSGGAKRQIGFDVTLSGNLTASGANMRAAIDAVKDYVVDVRATDINGHVRTLAEDRTAGCMGDLTFGESVPDSNSPDAVMIPFEWFGFMTVAKWTASYSES